LAVKTASEMTYTVSAGALNSIYSVQIANMQQPHILHANRIDLYNRLHNEYNKL